MDLTSKQRGKNLSALLSEVGADDVLGVELEHDERGSLLYLILGGLSETLQRKLSRICI